METSEETPKCQCGQPSVVTVNGARSCVDHLDDVMSERLSGVRDALRDYYSQAAEDV